MKFYYKHISIIISLFFTFIYASPLKGNNIFIIQVQTQVIITGRVTDQEGKPIPYVNIGIINGTNGTVSDSSGVFVLNIKKFVENDIIRISALGYENLEIIMNSFIKNPNPTYELIKELRTVNIEEVIVNSKKRERTKTLGISSSSKNIRIGFRKGVLGQEIATYIKNNNKLKLQKVIINVVENTFKDTPFRINVYTIKDGIYENILNDNIIFTVSNKSDAQKIILNLSSSNLIVKEDFIISLELIDSREEGELHFSGSIFSKGLMRKTSQGKFEQIPINPSISVETTVLK